MPAVAPIGGSDGHYWWIFLVRALLFFLGGFLAFRYPLESYLTLGVLFGITILLTGIIEVVFALSQRKMKTWGWRLFSGIVDLILGVVLVMHIGLGMAVLPIYVSIGFLFRGVTLLSFSDIVKDSPGAPWMIDGGTLMIFVALVLMIRPAIGTSPITTCIAIGFFIASICNIIQAIRLKGGDKGEKKDFDLVKG